MSSLFRYPSFTSNYNLLLPFITSFLNNHKHLSPQTQTPFLFVTRNLFSTNTTHNEAPATTKMPISLYLTQTLNFTKQQSLATSNKLKSSRARPRVKDPTDIISCQNANSVITFLNTYLRFNPSHIKTLVSKFPNILSADVDKTIKPKIKLLQDVGFSTSDLAHVLSRNPRLYLESDLGPAVQALRGILGSDEHVVRIFRRMTMGNASEIINKMIPNMTMLENEFGIRRERVRKYLCQQPIPLIMMKAETLRDSLSKIEDKWGISRDSEMFFRAFHVFSGLTDANIYSKSQVFKSFGWSESDILTLIRKFPCSIGLSQAKVKKALEFYMNELGYEPAYLASRPVLLGYSLEKRVVPRYRVLSILKEKGLIKVDYQFYNAITVSEDRFLSRYILPYEDVVPKLRQVYLSGRAALPDEET